MFLFKLYLYHCFAMSHLLSAYWWSHIFCYTKIPLLIRNLITSFHRAVVTKCIYVKFMQNSSTCWWCDARSTWRKPSNCIATLITHRRCSEEVSTPENYARAAMTHIIIIAVSGAHRRVLSRRHTASRKTKRSRQPAFVIARTWNKCQLWLRHASFQHYGNEMQRPLFARAEDTKRDSGKLKNALLKIEK